MRGQSGYARPADLAETLLCWLDSGRSTGEVAAGFGIHPQTVRYLPRQLEELFGSRLQDPDLVSSSNWCCGCGGCARRRTRPRREPANGGRTARCSVQGDGSVR